MWTANQNPFNLAGTEAHKLARDDARSEVAALAASRINGTCGCSARQASMQGIFGEYTLNRLTLTDSVQLYTRWRQR